MENGLIIFVSNLEKGKVKSRLAETTGDDKAFDVYKYLLQHTKDAAVAAHCNHFIFYSSYIHINDVFDDDSFTKFIQEGDEPGERIMKAFEKVFALGVKKVCIIKGDCYELQTEHLQQAFEQLNNNDIVIGPSLNGGYYLLGMKQLHRDIFLHEKQETVSILNNTLDSTKALGLNSTLLPVLSEIDTIEDLLKTNILTHLQEDEDAEKDLL